MNNTDMAIQLEEIVDHTTLLATVATLERMSHERAERVRAHWQDEEIAKQWELCAKALGKAMQAIDKTNVGTYTQKVRA